MSLREPPQSIASAGDARPQVKPLTGRARAALRALLRGGRITAEQVRDAAQDPKSPLHGYFEWDDSRAGDLWRLEQARVLLRRFSVELIVQETKYVVPEYLRDPRKDDDEAGYVSLDQVRKSRAESKALMLAELHRIEALVDRAIELEGVLGINCNLAGVKAAIENSLEKIS